MAIYCIYYNILFHLIQFVILIISLYVKDKSVPNQYGIHQATIFYFDVIQQGECSKDCAMSTMELRIC